MHRSIPNICEAQGESTNQVPSFLFLLLISFSSTGGLDRYAYGHPAFPPQLHPPVAAVCLLLGLRGTAPGGVPSTVGRQDPEKRSLQALERCSGIFVKGIWRFYASVTWFINWVIGCRLEKPQAMDSLAHSGREGHSRPSKMLGLGKGLLLIGSKSSIAHVYSMLLSA